MHAIVAALVGWTYVAAFAGLGHGNVSWLRALKWADFVHFYTLGDIARTQSTALLYDTALQHARQVALVPESIADVFIPVYPPQTALLFAPLSLLPYLPAGLIWVLVTVAAYGWSVWFAWRPARERLPDRTLLVAAALAFPPVWQLAAYGQTAAVVIVAFAVSWWALERGQDRKSTRLNSSHIQKSRMPSSA